MNISPSAGLPYNLRRNVHCESPRDYAGVLSATGKGVGVAVFDSGIYPHPDLDANLVASVTVTPNGRQDSDWKGHGSAVGSVIAGDGKISEGKIRGIAPDAKLISVQILPPGEEKPEDVYAGVMGGIDWVIANKDEYNIKVINMSAGLQLIRKPDPTGQFQYLIDPLNTAIQKAIEAGITVVAAAGNEGNGPGSLGTVLMTPATNPNVITVGAMDTHGTPGDRSDDSVAPFSSRGPTPDNRTKPDILAPGVGILVANIPHSEIAERNESSAATLASLGQAQGGMLLHQILDKVHHKELYSSAMTESVPALRAALEANAPAAIAAKIGGVQDLTVLEIADKLLSVGRISEESLKPALDSLRSEVREHLQPRITKYFLEDGNPAYISMDGTSFAAPLVSGTIADMYEANPNLSPAQVREILTSTADRIADAGPNDQGAGVLNAAAAIERARQLARAA